MPRYHGHAVAAGDLFEVIRAHQVALAKRQKEWAVIEAPLTDSDADALDVANRVGSLSQRERDRRCARIVGNFLPILARIVGGRIAEVVPVGVDNQRCV